MNTGNVYEHQTALWSRLAKHCEQEKKYGADARALWPAIAADMFTLRNQYKADREFSVALMMHGIEYNSDDRAAFIWMGSLRTEALRDALALCDSRSPRYFRKEIESRNDDYFSPVSLSSETDQQEDREPENSAETIAEPEKKDEAQEKNTEPNQKRVQIPRMDNRNILYRHMGEEIARAVFEHWTERNTQQAFNKLVQVKGGQKAIRRIVEMIPDYLNGPNSRSCQYKFSHRVLVPEMDCSKWSTYYGCDWTNVKGINQILDEMPDAKQMVNELGSGRAIAEYEKWWEARKGIAVEHAGPNLSAFSKPTEDKPRIRAVEGSEHDLIAAYGVEIWPAESPSYSFDEAWAAYQLWKTEDQALSTANGFERSQARGRHFMSQCDYLNRVSKGFVTAWRKIATAQYSNPENGDDCCCPSQHINISA